MAHIEPLLVTMSVRNYLPFWWWFKELNIFDRLVIKNYTHEDAHRIAREFFLEHDEYTHFIFLSEDIIATLDHISTILYDTEKYPNAVIAGLSNIDFTHDDVNISFRNMYNIVVSGRETYRHPKIDDIVTGRYGWPLVRVWFQGNTLACYPRHIVEKLSFKPYRYHRESDTMRYFGYRGRHGIMFDFQMCRELHELGIPIYVDLRVLVLHMKTVLGSFKFAHKKRFVRLIKEGGEVITIREDPPYTEEQSKETGETEEVDKKRWFHEKFLGIKG